VNDDTRFLETYKQVTNGVRSVTADYIEEEEDDDNFKSIWEAGSDYMDQTVGPI
jgi:hypothetical protein